MNQSHDELQRRLDDLLRQMERRRRGRLWRSWVRKAWHRVARYVHWPNSPGELMIVSLVLVVLSAVLTPFIRVVSQPLGLIGVLLFVLAFVTSFMRPSSADREVRWRGRLVARRSTPWWERIYFLLYQRRWN